MKQKKQTKSQTEKFYRRLLAEQRRSGLSIRAFAQARGVPAGTLSSWSHQLRKRDAARRRKRGARPSFVPVQVVGAASALAPESRTPSASAQEVGQGQGGYEVVLGAGRVLRLPSDFDDARAATLVRLVASC